MSQSDHQHQVHEVEVVEVHSPSGDIALVDKTNIVEIPVMGEMVRMLREPNCLVCQQSSAVRGAIEEMILRRFTYQEMLSVMPPDCTLAMLRDGTPASLGTFTKRIQRHFGRGERPKSGIRISHSSVSITEALDLRESINRVRNTDGLDEIIASHLETAVAVKAEGWKRFLNGDLKMTMADFLAVSREVQEMMGEEHSDDGRLFQDALQAVVEEVSKVLPTATLQALAASLEANPLFAKVYAETQELPASTA
jgi:hypothetical protein